MLLLTLACSGSSSSEPAQRPPSRVDAVVTVQEEAKAEAPETWCDLYAKPGERKPFVWPELDGEKPPAGGEWTWVNAWATWCKPCIAEMPMLVAWQSKLQSEVGEGGLRFLSLDAGAAEVQRFAAANPELPLGPRIADAETMEPWLAENGVDGAGAVLPIHFLLDARQEIACVYMSAIGEGDYLTVKSILGAG